MRQLSAFDALSFLDVRIWTCHLESTGLDELHQPFFRRL